MARPKKTTPLHTDALLSLVSGLSDEHRRELLQSALIHHFAEIVGRHQQATLGDFVDLVRADSRWNVLKNVRVGELIEVQGQPVGLEARRESKKADAGSAEPGAQLALVQSADEAQAKTRAAKAPRAVKADHADIFDRIFRLVKESPGLRGEEIQKRLDAPPILVKPALARMRLTKQLRSEGIKRAMKYFATA